MKIIESLKSRMNKIDRNKSIIFSFPILFFILITFIVVLADPVPTRSVEITSNYSGQGSWTINKSAEWISANKSRISLELNSQMKSTGRNKDIILVMDISGSMSGSKLNKAKEDAKDLVSTLLTDSNNRIALITFESTASKLSDLTNNATTLNDLIDNLTVSGSTNYNSGLVEAKNIIDNYTQVSNKDLVVLFLTDGFPNVEVPNQVSTYQIIKEQYPYVVINAIQYEMGKDIIQDIIDISDNQFIASMKTLNNVLFEVCTAPEYFENFKVEDYINENFEIESIGNISSTKGTVNLSIENGLQKVTWNLGSNYRTGNTETLTIDVVLKEEKRSLDQLFETNDHEKITSKLESDTEREVNSQLTPILQGKYTVIYDTNTPTGCTLSNIPSERYFAYETVNIRAEELSCSNYIFRGYEVEDLDVKKINTSSFIMPGHDVTIRAIWSKVDISQKMDGEVATALDFYKIIKNEYKSNSGYAGKYTGNHQDSYNREATKDIYYYTTKQNNTTQGNVLLDKINVIFAGYCWQMLRTTDTGGVKMIYNGVPVDDKCSDTRTNTNGLKQGARTTSSMNASYAYGSDFTYDLNAKTFKIAGTIKENINYSSDKSVIGYYTCKNADKDATCTTLYYLEEESSTNTSPYVYSFTIGSTNYFGIGWTPFNGLSDSPAYVGYMYNTSYNASSISKSFYRYYTVSNSLLQSTSLNTTYWYSDSINFGTVNYELVNPYKVNSTSDYSSLVGKYTFRNTSETYTTYNVYYIEAVSGSTMYYRQLTSANIGVGYYYGDAYDYGETTENKYTIENATSWTTNTDVTGKYVTNGANSSNIYYVIAMVGNRIFYESLAGGNKLKYNETLLIGDSITDNGNGTYTLNNTTSVSLANYYTNYTTYKEKYTCGDSNNVCKSPRYIVTTTTTNYSYLNPLIKILISKTRNGLELTNTLLVSLDELSKNYSNYIDYKYTCNTTSSTCTEDTLMMFTDYYNSSFSAVKNMYYGESVTWDGTKYTLNNVLGIETIRNTNALSTHHYVCVDSIGTECARVGFVYYSDLRNLCYILLENGVETISDALDHMLFDNNVNAKDSAIKRLVEKWYQTNLLSYDSYLEETIYCNNRSISNIGGFKDNGNITNLELQFKEYTLSGDLSCTNETDKFSVSNNKAKLKYKIGLSSSPEMYLLNNSKVRGTDFIWLGSPNFFREEVGQNTHFANERVIAFDGSINSSEYLSSQYLSRSVISLASGVVPSSGTGTMNDPYVVDETVIPGN